MDNPYYTGTDSCASKLAGLLMQAEMLAQSPEGIKKLAYIVVELLKKTVMTTGGNLGACAPDVPAVLLAVTSTYCPATGKLYNPFVTGGAFTACTPTNAVSGSCSLCQHLCRQPAHKPDPDPASPAYP